MLDDWERKRALFAGLFAALLVGSVTLAVVGWGDATGPRFLAIRVLPNAVVLAVLLFRPGLVPGFEGA